ncbi:MAG: hypothetical protein WBG57_13825 [Ornithinimicrobium sp.]
MTTHASTAYPQMVHHAAAQKPGSEQSKDSAPGAGSPVIDFGTLMHFQGRLNGICPDHFGLRCVIDADRICFYATRDLAIPYDEFVQSVDIVRIERHVRRGTAALVRRVDHSADERRVWTVRTPSQQTAGVGDQGYVAVRRRPDGGVRVAMLSMRNLRLPSSLSWAGLDQWPWLRTRLAISDFRCVFRHTIGRLEAIYAGPDLSLTH